MLFSEYQIADQKNSTRTKTKIELDIVQGKHLREDRHQWSLSQTCGFLRIQFLN